MDFREFVEERNVGVYSIVESSNSPVLEAFGKKQVNHEIDLHSQGFKKYLKYIYKDRSIGQEIKAATTMDLKWELAKKYSGDYENYKKIKKAGMASTIAYAGSVAATLAGISVPQAATALLMFGPGVYAYMKQRFDRDVKQTQLYRDYVDKAGNKEFNDAE